MKLAAQLTRALLGDLALAGDQIEAMHRLIVAIEEIKAEVCRCHGCTEDARLIEKYDNVRRDSRGHVPSGISATRLSFAANQMQHKLCGSTKLCRCRDASNA